MNATETFQISVETAETYEAAFVPSLSAHLAPHLLDAAEVTAGDHVLDVACGTGIVARMATERIGPAGRVVGLDRNEAMLTVARRIRPDLDWRRGEAMSLPFPDDSFDVVLCQSGLMFVPDPAAAVGEMARVVRPGGRVAAQVWSSLDVRPHPAARRGRRPQRRPGRRRSDQHVLPARRPGAVHRPLHAGRPTRDRRPDAAGHRAGPVRRRLHHHRGREHPADRPDHRRRVPTDSGGGTDRPRPVLRPQSGALVLPLEAYLVAARRR
jgi:SAM-dependent methyltransferase